MDYAPITPIGFDEPRQRSIERRCRIERQEASNYLKQLKLEGQALKLAEDYNFVLMASDMAKNCEDMRARASWAKIVADITRLGKREPVGQQQVNNTQVNLISDLSPDQAKDVLRSLAAGRRMMSHDKPSVINVSQACSLNDSLTNSDNTAHSTMPTEANPTPPTPDGTPVNPFSQILPKNGVAQETNKASGSSSPELTEGEMFLLEAMRRGIDEDKTS